MTPEELYQRYVPLIRHVAYTVKRTYNFTDEDTEDIVSAIALKVIAVPREKAEHELGEGYIRMVINNTVRNEIRRINKERHIKLYEDFALPAETSMDGEAQQYETEDTRQDLHLQQLNQDTLNRYLSTLKPDELRIVELMLGSAKQAPMTQREIAKELGITQQWINQSMKRTYIRFRKRHKLQ